MRILDSATARCTGSGTKVEEREEEKRKKEKGKRKKEGEEEERRWFDVLSVTGKQQSDNYNYV